MDTPASDKQATPTEDEIALYLKNHPGFFLNRDDLLLGLQLTQSSGGAISLLERQVSVLRDRNVEMRQRLGNLLDNARTNDQLFDKTKRLILSLLEAQGIDDIVNTFNRDLVKNFDIDFAAITLFGNPLRHKGTTSRIINIEEAHQKIGALMGASKAVCGVLRPEEMQFLFRDQAANIGSAAVVSLSFGHPLGILAIGSKDPLHFRSSMGTLFLSYIAEVLNRLLPRYLTHESE